MMFLKRCLVVLIACALVMCASTDSEARRVYLNGVRIDGLTGQTFVNVKVRIDDKGDLYITGSQYKVRVKGAKTRTAPRPTTAPPTATNSAPIPAPVPTPAALTPRPSQKYVAVIQRTGSQASGYSLKIIVNGRTARKITLHAEQDVFDLTPYFKKGENKVMIEAYKENANAGGSVNVLFGKGKLEKGRVYIQKPYLIQYTRQGSEAKNYRHIYNVQVD